MAASNPTTNTHILYTYTGIVEITPTANALLSNASDAKGTNYGDQYWFTTPIIEISDEKFRWMERTVWVGMGHWAVDEKGKAVEYEAYRVKNEEKLGDQDGNICRSVDEADLLLRESQMADEGKKKGEGGDAAGMAEVGRGAF
jgi:hypothetical protein